MKKKQLLFVATAIFIASCSDTSYLGDQAAVGEGVGGPISFNFDVPAVTRAGGSTAATALSSQFIVWGEKNETEANKAIDAGVDDATNSRTGHLVFPNYIVNWVDNAHSTTSNSNGWEYVGYKFDDASATIQTTDYTTNVVPNTTPTSGAAPVQTIKYWDNAASSYTFTAVSALPADISAGKVRITKTTSNPTSVYNKGYSVVVNDEADLAHLYFSDRVNMVPGTNPVTLTFRNSISQVRVGMYETVPGYDVKVTKFYYATSHAASTPAFTDMTGENTTNFVADVPNVSPASGKTSVAGTFTVKYYEKSTANDAAGITNHPTISFAPTTGTDSKITLSLGTGVYNTKLEESSATPTYDKTSGAFTTVFPQENNSTNLKLKIDYQLYNTTTGETIDFIGKTAEVPAQYLQWKPNYKYTYIFKISDNDLTPITFDAVQIEAENGNVEYITTVTEPSITTFGYDETNNKYVASSNDYAVGNDIYVTIMDNGSVVVPTPHNNFHLYSNIVSSDPTNFPITEASVKEAIEVASTGTKKITFDHPCNEANSWFDTHCIAVTSVPAEDGTTKTVNAVKLTGLTAGTYAVQYRKTAVEDDSYAIVDASGFTALTDVSSYFIRSYTYTACGASATAVGGTKYYSESSGVYTEVDGLSEGDDVSTYYTRNENDYTYVAATGTYVSGTTYYSKTAGGALSAGNNYYKVIIVH